MVSDVAVDVAAVLGVGSAGPAAVAGAGAGSSAGSGSVASASRLPVGRRITDSAGTDGPVSLLVIATDGVWDVMSNIEVLEVATKTIKSTRSVDQAAAAVVRAASSKGSQDDISAVIVWFA